MSSCADGNLNDARLIDLCSRGTGESATREIEVGHVGELQESERNGRKKLDQADFIFISTTEASTEARCCPLTFLLPGISVER